MMRDIIIATFSFVDVVVKYYIAIHFIIKFW